MTRALSLSETGTPGGTPSMPSSSGGPGWSRSYPATPVMGPGTGELPACLRVYLHSHLHASPGARHLCEVS